MHVYICIHIYTHIKSIYDLKFIHGSIGGYIYTGICIDIRIYIYIHTNLKLDIQIFFHYEVNLTPPSFRNIKRQSRESWGLTVPPGDPDLQRVDETFQSFFL